MKIHNHHSLYCTGGDQVSDQARAHRFAPVSAAMVVDDPNVVDYAQRYNEIVLGQNPTNWGNIVLVIMIGLIAVGKVASLVDGGAVGREYLDRPRLSAMGQAGRWIG